MRSTSPLVATDRFQLLEPTHHLTIRVVMARTRGWDAGRPGCPPSALPIATPASRSARSELSTTPRHSERRALPRSCEGTQGSTRRREASATHMEHQPHPALRIVHQRFHLTPSDAGNPGRGLADWSSSDTLPVSTDGFDAPARSPRRGASDNAQDLEP